MNPTERATLALQRALGDSRVDTDPEVCEAMSRDESDVPAVTAACVVSATRPEHVATALAVCADLDVPLFPRGGGTGRTGGAVAVRPGVVLDTRGLADLVEIDRVNLLAVVGPGMITEDLQRAVAAEGLMFPPDPLSAPWSCLGGNVAENAGGPRAFKYGVTRDWTLGMDAALMGGETLSVGRRTTKGVSGYDLTSTLVGSEGTLAVFTSLTLRLRVAPPVLRGLTAAFASAEDAGAAVAAVVARGLRPRCLELIDDTCCAVMRDLEPDAVPAGVGALLLIEVDGDSDAEVDLCLARVAEACEDAGGACQVARDAAELDALWSARRVMSRALRGRARHKLSEDVVVPRASVPTLLRAVREISLRRGLVMPTYGHAGDGNLHVNVLWDDPSQRPAVDAAVEDLFRATLALRGTLTGEHGIGVTKLPYLPWEQSASLISLQRRVKDAFDPAGLLNPGKIFAPSAGHRGC